MLKYLVGWKGYAAAALLALALGAAGAWRLTSWANSGTIENLRGQVSHQVDLTGAAQANAQTEKNAAKTCSDSVKNIKKEADDRVAKANADLAKARAARAAKPDPVKTILATPAPDPATDICKAADALIMETVQ